MRARSRELPWFAGAILAALVFAALLAPYLGLPSPTEGDITQRLIPPVWTERGDREHPLGTDRFGRDVLSRVVHGSRISLVVSLVAIGVAGTLGTALGLISGCRCQRSSSRSYWWRSRSRAFATSSSSSRSCSGRASRGRSAARRWRSRSRTSSRWRWWPGARARGSSGVTSF